MNSRTLCGAVVAPALGLALLAGCSSNKTTETAGQGEYGETAGTMAPAPTIAGIWAQIAAQQDKVTVAIRDGKLQDIHHLAFGIRDLVVALADKATVAAPAGGAGLKDLVAQVNTSAARLDEMGDTGNLAGTRSEFAKLNALLVAIKAVAGQ